MKRIITIIALLLPMLTASAQRIVGELEANTDMFMTPGDSLLEQEKEDGKKKKNVPVDIRAWNIDPTYGNITAVPVDTTNHMMHNKNLSEGTNGHFEHLGNLGSPRLNRVFMERKDFDSDFIFLQPFDQFYTSPGQFKYYNTKSPFLNATYNFCGSKTTGDDHVKVVYTNNANRHINIGGLFDYMYGQGYYDSQSTSYMGASGWASYTGDTYNLHLQYTHNYMKLAENGGITDENYITHPENMERSYASNDIPTWLSSTWSKQEHDIIHLNHRYNFGFYRTVGDSAKISEEFVPVASIFHTFDLKSLRRAYIAYNTPPTYHTYDYFPADTTNDRTRYFSMKNIVGLSLREGFNRYAEAGLNAYVSFQHQTFQMPDTLSTPLGQASRYTPNNKQSENTMSIGGQILRTQGHTLHYNINAEVGITGVHSGDLDLQAQADLNLPLLGDTATARINAYIKRQTPNYYMRHYHSRHAWWDLDLSRETRTRIEGQLSWEKTHTKLTVGVENLKNYTYFKYVGNANANASSTIPAYTKGITPAQHSENLQVVGANLQQNFHFGVFHLDNDITFQTTTNKDIIPLPTLMLYHNMYVSFTYAHVLNIELGADLKYFSEYYAPDYSPIVSQYMVQNPDNKVKVGNYPIVSIYANFDLKRTRFYIQYYHANQSDGRYFWAPGYPVNPKGIHMGISWNFYD